MGQAKLKGTLAERQQVAAEREAALAAARDANLKRLEDAEALSTQRSNLMLDAYTKRYMDELKRHSPLATADWTLVASFGDAINSDVIKAEVKKVIEADLAAM